MNLLESLIQRDLPAVVQVRKVVLNIADLICLPVDILANIAVPYGIRLSTLSSEFLLSE